MTLGALVALAATFAVFALTPGPAVTAIVARAITDGAKPALALNAGVVTGELLFLGLAAAGMAAAAKSLGELFTVLRWLGVIYLLWQGLALWRTRARVAVSVGTAGHETHFWRNFAAGLLLMLGHVQAILFYAALLPGFVDFANLAPAELGLIAALQLVIVGGANSAYALLAAQARGFFANERAQRALHRVAAAMMGVAAVLVATKV
ncbi:MAG TPA: LysE family translocator [Steroidobacteraceae bacterium]|nr:LysE family translocator [Steroidobacteraceae bacterium]